MLWRRMNKGKMSSTSEKESSRAPSQIQTSDAQQNSRLFQIPQELRDMIYTQLFIDTRLCHGILRDTDTPTVQIVPASNALSIQRSCRRARAEIGDSWLGQILFHFMDPGTMLTKLGTLPIPTLSKVRHVRIADIMYSCSDGKHYYYPVQYLKLLPGLRLDTLTIFGCHNTELRDDSEFAYIRLDMLMECSQGWKELRFISKTSALLGFVSRFYIAHQQPRCPQPADWIYLMNNRDGTASQPSVSIYRSTLAGQSGTVGDEVTRVKYEQALPRPGEEDEFTEEKCGGDLMLPDEVTKELMVVVRRGRGVDYQEKLGSPFLDTIMDPRQENPGLTEASIIAKIFEYEPKGPFEIKQDIYKHADDYEWLI
ncbi:hypothetical protein F4680DRAFT_226956 [Xylaria scruposa]|nr:hypothetical protein F4680DRAFT_226956 [Xylaria scruposa]